MNDSSSFTPPPVTQGNFLNAATLHAKAKALLAIVSFLILSGSIITSCSNNGINSTSQQLLSGGWFGTVTFTSPRFVRQENGDIFLNLVESGNGILNGTMQLGCDSFYGSDQGYGISGNTDGASIALIWQSSQNPNFNQDLNFQGTFNTAKVMLSTTTNDNIMWNMSLQRGSQSDYNAACHAFGG